MGQQVQGLLPPCERGFRARGQAGERPSQPDMRGSTAGQPLPWPCRAHPQSCCNSAGDCMEPHQERQRDKGWPGELLLWHGIASGGGRRNTTLIGYYLNDLMCADKYCSFSACTRKETKNIPKFLFHFCWLLCSDSVRLLLGGEILLAKEYQGGSI